MLVVVGDVVHQQSAADGIGGAGATNILNLHRLSEVSVGGGCVDAVAIVERIVQGLNECRLVGDLLVVINSCRRLFSRNLRTEEEIRVNHVTDNLTEGADLGGRP